MTTISKTGINSNTNILIQQLAKGSARQALASDSTLPASSSPAPFKPNQLNSQLGAILNKWSDAQQAVDKWGDVTQQINQSKKAFAAEVLRRVKEQIRILMMLTGGDPKARARQIALLAKELAAAAREYASASGAASQTNVVSTAGSVGDQSSSAAVAPDAAVAEQSGQDVTPDVSATTPAGAAASMQYQQISAHQLNEQLGDKIAEYSKTDSASQEDLAFAMEVRKLAAQLKALAKQNEVRERKGTDQSTRREMADLEEALKDIEKSLSSLGTPDAAPMPSINIVAA
jgi:organic radical activating enzyme